MQNVSMKGYLYERVPMSVAALLLWCFCMLATLFTGRLIDPAFDPAYVYVTVLIILVFLVAIVTLVAVVLIIVSSACEEILE